MENHLVTASWTPLTDYVLVSSKLMRVEHYVRQEGGAWALTEYDQPEQRLPLRSVDCELPLEEIYYCVTFSEKSAD